MDPYCIPCSFFFCLSTVGADHRRYISISSVFSVHYCTFHGVAFAAVHQILPRHATLHIRVRKRQGKWSICTLLILTINMHFWLRKVGKVGRVCIQHPVCQNYPDLIPLFYCRKQRWSNHWKWSWRWQSFYNKPLMKWQCKPKIRTIHPRLQNNLLTFLTR